VRPSEEGHASGANNAISELGGVFGVAVLASIFDHYGSYRTAETFSSGMSAAVYVGAAVPAVTAALIPRRRRGAEIEVGVLRPALNEAA